MTRMAQALSAIFVAAGLMIAPAFAQAPDAPASPAEAVAPAAAPFVWRGPDMGRRPNLISADVDFALAELCFRYILTDDAVAIVADRQGVVAARRGQPGSYWVGNTGLVVQFTDTADGRACDVFALRGEAARLEEDFRTRLAEVPLTLAAYQFPKGRFRAREFYCGPVDGPHIGALVSFEGEERDLPKLRATFRREPRRSPQCDRAPDAN